jgi:hypothetical protein
VAIASLENRQNPQSSQMLKLSLKRHGDEVPNTHTVGPLLASTPLAGTPRQRLKPKEGTTCHEDRAV